MERLNNKQKKILTELDSVYPNSLKKDSLLEKVGYAQNDILADVKLLEKNKFITAIYGLGDFFPQVLTITAEGKEKLRESFFTRLKDSAHNNPWVVITVIIAIIFGVPATYYYFQSNNLQAEKAELEKPLLITQDLRAIGGSAINLAFVVKNPSHSVDYYYLSGTCNPENPSLFSQSQEASPPPNPPASSAGEQSSEPPLIITPAKNTGVPIPAGGEITLLCEYNYINKPIRDMITNITICVNIKGLQEPICNKMQVTVLQK